MENLNLAEIILAIAAVLGPIATLVLGMLQSRNQEKRGKADDMLDISTAMKNMGETWEEIVAGLRTEIERVRKGAIEREKELLANLQTMRMELDNTKNRVETVLKEEREKSDKMEATLQARIKLLSKQVEDLTQENYTLRILVDDLTKKLEQRDKIIVELRTDISKLKRDTGELKLQKRTGELDDAMKSKGSNEQQAG